MSNNSFDVIQKHVEDAFNLLPRPPEVGEEFNIWTIRGPMDTIHVTLRKDSNSYYTDLAQAWVFAKILNQDGEVNQRFAVGIRWSGDELETLECLSPEECGCILCVRVRKAVLCFPDLAAPFDEGGVLPEPLIGRSMLQRSHYDAERSSSAPM